MICAQTTCLLFRGKLRSDVGRFGRDCVHDAINQTSAKCRFSGTVCLVFKGAPVYGVLMSVDPAFGVENRSRDASMPSPTDLLEAFFFSLLILVIELKTKQM